ncbi:MAG: hypothetical protein E7662_10605 [Ruminococcaceae bacterium]|nr:hypothetical protein [Oscillospiraceae bacterium]
MANVKKVAFRPAISGYNREDVNQYILDMNRDFEEREAALRDAAQAAEEKLKEAAEFSAALEVQIGEAEAVSAALRESIDRLKEENASLRDQAQSSDARAAELMGRLDASEKEASALRDELNSRAQTAEASEKSLKYDQISAQIGDIMINANSSAEQIIAAANTEAGKIMTETEEEAMYIRTRLSDTADEMLSAISERLHVSTENCLGELLNALREMRDSTDALLREFGKRNHELSEKIEYYHANVSDTVAKSLSEMDEKYGIRKK